MLIHFKWIYTVTSFPGFALIFYCVITSSRSNPEMCDSDDDGSDSDGITATQAAVRQKDKLQAVRSFIQSDPALYGRVLQYQPLSLCELKAGLRAAGIRLSTTKLLDFLDSQCITFTTAKQGHPAPSRRRARGAGRGRKKLAKAVDWGAIKWEPSAWAAWEGLLWSPLSELHN